MRTIFFGTPEIAVPALRALSETTNLVAVVCQPDRPAGRGLELSEPAVKRAARELGVETHQPLKVRTGNLDEWVRAHAPDVAVVMAYGRILPASVLSAPRRGCMNLHASLLPKYRGAAPVQWAIIRGEAETGISLMQMDEGMDTGPVYCERRLPISREDTAGTLSAKLADLGAVVIRDDLPRAVDGALALTPQDVNQVTEAPPLTRTHGAIEWSGNAPAIADLVRGLAPKPGAFTTLGGRVLKLLVVESHLTGQAKGEPGVVVRADKGGLYVACGAGTVMIIRAQMEGRKAMSAPDLVNGRAVRLGDVLGT